MTCITMVANNRDPRVIPGEVSATLALSSVEASSTMIISGSTSSCESALFDGLRKKSSIVVTSNYYGNLRPSSRC